MEKQLIRLLLDYDFYSNNKHKLTRELFPAPLDGLFRTITHAHGKYSRSLTFDEVEELHRALNPTATTAAMTAIYDLLDEIKKLDPIGPDVATDVLDSIWRKEIGRQIASAALDLSDGTVEGLGRVKELIEKAEGGFVPNASAKAVEADLDKLMEFFEQRDCWTFNIPTLYEKLPGGASGEFMIFFARPEVGKTAGWVSLVAGPGGFCEQGAKVLAFTNEEPAERTMMRAISARTGLTRKQIFDNKGLAVSRMGDLRDMVKIYDDKDNELTLDFIDAECKLHKPDVIVIDQLDKVQTHGSFDRPDLRLAHIYRSAREIAKRHNCFVIAISQAGAEADGKTHVTPVMLDGSRTGKFAEADIIIGVGVYQNTGQEEDMTRILYVGKNKINGFHGPVVCILNKELSRYEA